MGVGEGTGSGCVCGVWSVGQQGKNEGKRGKGVWFPAGKSEVGGWGGHGQQGGEVGG